MGFIFFQGPTSVSLVFGFPGVRLVCDPSRVVFLGCNWCYWFGVCSWGVAFLEYTTGLAFVCRTSLSLWYIYSFFVFGVVIDYEGVIFFSYMGLSLVCWCGINAGPW
uniref:Uncharacterized protein n=1 Tax=Cannabis sativa TaxID=3483 RepID=A0A803R3G3_CANSA